jgi:peptidoglycan/xylan/chitin deacetylase (PgdA/CDA1 family)
MTTAKAVPVLMYHHVSPNPGLVTLTPANFRAQMRHLARNGWRTVGLDDLARFIGGEPLPEKSVVVTFDDGYLDNWVHAHPIMAEHGLHGVIFLITGWIGDGPARPHAGMADVPATPAHRACMEAVQAGRADDVMLRWSEVQAMREAGTFEFHSHTHSHTRWDRVEPDRAMRDAKLAADLRQSRETLHTRLGQATPHLCWPQGYHDDGYRATATSAGFTHLYSVRRGTCLPDTAAGQIPRIVVKDKAGPWFASRLAIYRSPWLSSLYDLIH